MSALRLLAIPAAVCLFASCSSNPNPGAPTTTQEFNTSTSQWVTTNRIATPGPTSTAAPVAQDPTATPQEKPGLLKKTGSALKAPFKWLPGVD